MALEKSGPKEHLNGHKSDLFTKRDLVNSFLKTKVQNHLTIKFIRLKHSFVSTDDNSIYKS